LESKGEKTFLFLQVNVQTLINTEAEARTEAEERRSTPSSMGWGKEGMMETEMEMDVVVGKRECAVGLGLRA
jgi:hypothetical protein